MCFGLMHAMDILAQIHKADEALAAAGCPPNQAQRDDIAIAHAVVCRLVSASTARIGVFLSGPLTDAQADQLEEATRSMEAIGQRAEERLLDRCLAAARADRLGDS